MQNLKYLLYDSMIFSHLLVMCLWAWKAPNFELLSQSGQEAGTHFCPRAEWRRIQFAQPELHNDRANICQIWSTQPHNLRRETCWRKSNGTRLPSNSGHWSTRQAVWSHHPSPPTPVLHIPDVATREQELEKKENVAGVRASLSEPDMSQELQPCLPSFLFLFVELGLACTDCLKILTSEPLRGWLIVFVLGRVPSSLSFGNKGHTFWTSFLRPGILPSWKPGLSQLQIRVSIRAACLHMKG